MRLSANPRFAEFKTLLAAKPDLLTTWAGDGFRFHTTEYPSPVEIVSGDGSLRHGGRWNAPGACRVVYASTTDETALAECKANDRYYGTTTRTPRLLVALDVRLARRLDLTSATVRRRLGLTLALLHAEDWRKLQESGRESLTQALGRAAFAAGAEGLRATSAAVRGGVNVVVFPQNLRRESRVAVWEPAKLARLPRGK